MTWTKTFSDEQYAVALEGWAWLDLEGLTPEFTSYFGDVFLSSPDGWWYLDTIEGGLGRLWPNRAAVEAELAAEAGQDRYLLSSLADAAAARGLTLGPDQVFAFMPPPVLGGSFDVANITAEDFVMSVNIAGQLHQQLRALPPGTTLGQIKIEGS